MNLKIKLSYLLSKIGLLFISGNTKQLKSGEEIKKHYSTPYNLFTSLKDDYITLNLQSKDEVNADFLDIIRTLNKKGKKIEIVQLDKEVLSIDDIKRLNSINPNILINFRFLVNSYYSGINLDTSYDVQTYIEIFNKFNFLAQVAKQHFKSDEEQFFFVVSQLNDYITYVELDDVKHEKIKDLSLKQILQNPATKNYYEVSGLKGAFLKRKTVCIGFSLALQRVLTQLNIPCEVYLGIPSYNINGEFVTHAWNQVYINGQWYNSEITWLNTSGSTDQLLASDKNFEEHKEKAVMTEKHECLMDYPKDKLLEMYNRMTRYRSVLEEYDRGIRNISVLPIKTEKFQSADRQEESQIIKQERKISCDKVQIDKDNGTEK